MDRDIKFFTHVFVMKSQYYNEIIAKYKQLSRTMN